jgi:AbrB family looped-hinge helix DNA binding protein
MVEVVSVTKKGQATIPKKLRQKYGIKDKVIFEENECGIVLKPVPSPAELMGSFKAFAKGKTARQLLEESRREEVAQEKEMMKHARKANL